MASAHSVFSGGTDNGDTVLSGGKMFVLAGGLAVATTVSSGGSLAVSGGGTDSGTTLVGGTGSTAKLAVEIVSAGGTDLAAVISSGGLQEVFGYASGATVSGAQSFFNPVFGGTQIVEAGGTASGTIVFSAGTLELLGTAVARGFTVSSGGNSRDCVRERPRRLCRLGRRHVRRGKRRNCKRDDRHRWLGRIRRGKHRPGRHRSRCADFVRRATDRDRLRQRHDGAERRRPEPGLGARQPARRSPPAERRTSRLPASAITAPQSEP